MRVRVRYFAAVREQAGAAEEVVDLPPGATVADLMTALQARHPRAAGLLGHSRVAQDDAFVPATAVLGAADADIIPPVSGG